MRRTPEYLFNRLLSKLGMVMARNNKILFLLALFFVIVGLLAALTPFSDFDDDGNLDSLLTEGFLLVPALCTVTGLFALLTRLSAACFAVSQPFSALLVPPPISNR
jgi:hypothetical protein